MHSVCKVWIIQKPKKVALWNKRHFEEKKQRVCSVFKIPSTYICWKKYIKCNIWRVAVRLSYIWDAGFLKVKMVTSFSLLFWPSSDHAPFQIKMVTSFSLLFRPSSDHASFQIKMVTSFSLLFRPSSDHASFQIKMVTSFSFLFRPSSDHASFQIKEKPCSHLNIKLEEILSQFYIKMIVCFFFKREWVLFPLCMNIIVWFFFNREWDIFLFYIKTIVCFF